MSADLVVRQFKEFINDKNTRAALENFFSEEHRFDEFYMNLLSNYKKPCHDLKDIKILFNPLSRKYLCEISFLHE